MDGIGEELLMGLLAKIGDRTAIVGVVGLGYAGLPVAIAFAEAGFKVKGIDSDRSRVDQLTEGRSYLEDVSSERVSILVAAGRLSVFSSYDELRESDAVLICVPTPLRDGQPDLAAVRAAGAEIAAGLGPGRLVVLESTTYPGTTEEVLKPLLENSGLAAGRDFHLAYSPERIDPGNVRFPFQSIPKVVGGLTPGCGDVTEALYSSVVDKVFRVSTPREAELAKLLENTFRHVNIALVNELAVYAHDLGIDIWQAIDAAATKPFGFMPFAPGPGVGGHCIGIDPSYLSWKVKQSQGHAFRFVELADELNRSMPKFVVERAAELLNERGRALNGAKILVIGAAYKPGVADTRESPALRIIELLIKRGAQVNYHDPLVGALSELSLSSAEITGPLLDDADLVVIGTPQPGVDYGLITGRAALVFDTRGTLRPLAAANVVFL